MTAGLVAILIGVLASPAFGIVYGEPDNGEHPSVGSIVVRGPGLVPVFDTDVLQACSGSLLDGSADDDVFLTAAHCLVGLQEFADAFDAEVVVTFDETITFGGTFFTGTLVPHPNFPANASNSFDIGVIVLDENPGVGYGRLPDAGILDELQDDHELRHETFTAVGYGTVRETRKKAFQSILDNFDRNKAQQEVLSLTGAWLTLAMNEATSNGGTCFGDSGGPHFFDDQVTIASITITGDAVCKATDKTYRLDTSFARDFLDDFVDLP